MSSELAAKQAFETWWDNLRRYRGGMPAKGTVGGSMVVLERLKSNYVLDLDFHRTSGGSQIKDVSGANVQKLLEEHSETRPFLSEGGRTNRGLAGDVGALLDQLRTMELEALSQKDRVEVINFLQGLLVEKVGKYFAQNRLQLIYDSAKMTWDIVRSLLREADETGKAGPVAEYLVGAKLQLRFPHIEVENKSYSTADEVTGRPGDFFIEDTAFHVTVHPTPGHFDRCRQNLNQGLRPYIIVPDEYLTGTRQNANLIWPGRIAVESIESFVSQNLDELSTFSKSKTKSNLRSLIEMYNRRVNEVERDKSLLIEIPRNL